MGFDFSNKTVGITGAASLKGIGFAIAKKFLQCNAKAGIFDKDENALKQAVDALKDFGNVKGYVLDVSKEADVKKVIAEFYKDMKGIDVWINNAGIYPQCPLMEMESSAWDVTMNVNLKSVFICTKEVFGYMKHAGGVIINAASYAAVISSAGSGAYAASKSGVYSLTKTLAAELAPYHIRVNGFIPGVIETGMTQEVVEERKEALVSAIALRKLGRPEDVANAAAFLASSEATYLTGTFIEVSGGKLCVQNPDFAWKRMEDMV